MPRTTQLLRFLTLVLVLLLSNNLVADNKKTTLTMFNWAGYLDPELIKGFEQKYAVNIREIYFNANEDRDRYLIENGIDNIDICIVDNYKVDTYLQRQWLAEFKPAAMPHLTHIDPDLSKNFPHLKNYAVPYMWGTAGLAYRDDLVKTPITTWKQVFEPAKELQGKILMSSDSFELIAAAMQAMGRSINNISLDSLQLAQKVLQKQKPYVSEYTTLGVDENVHLLSGDVWVAQTYSGDALSQQDKNEHIKYVVPEEGGVLWLDFMVILKKSKHQDLAQKFINYINDPRRAAQNATFISYASPNLAAREFLDKDFLQNSAIFPPDDTMSRLEHQTYPAPKILRRINMIHHQITR